MDGAWTLHCKDVWSLLMRKLVLLTRNGLFIKLCLLLKIKATVQEMKDKFSAIGFGPCQDGCIDYGEFVAMMQKGSNMGLGRRTMRKSLNMRNSLSISMRYAPGAH